MVLCEFIVRKINACFKFLELVELQCEQETRMLSQALNRAMSHSRNQLEGVNRKEVNILFSCSIVLCPQKNDTAVTHYRFNPYQPISVIFGRDVAERVCY